MAAKGSPIASATSISDLAGTTIAAPIGTTSYDYIVANIPDATAGSYTTLSDTVAALNAGQVDAIVVDAPTAFYLADPFVQEVKNGVVVGLFPPAGEQEYFGLTFVTGSPLVQCADLALAEIKADGTLDDDPAGVARREDQRRPGPRVHDVAAAPHGDGRRRVPGAAAVPAR